MYVLIIGVVAEAYPLEFIVIGVLFDWAIMMESSYSIDVA